MQVIIEGAGIAGQVLKRELSMRGIPSHLKDVARFPRDKVCGGILQYDSWEYLNKIFKIKEKPVYISSISHFWRGKKISTIQMDSPMVFIARLKLDDDLYHQQANDTALSEDAIRVKAMGIAAKRKGEWIGFQAMGPEVQDLQMHYGKGIYMGLCPTGESNRSHGAFIVRKDFYRDKDSLAESVKRELGVQLHLPLKGTGQICYGPTDEGIAVGDAKLTTHPFLGLGMKHAILSSRLLAELMQQERIKDYTTEHRRHFWKYNWISQWSSRIYDSPARILFWPILRYPRFFLPAYRWVHRR